MKFVIEIEYEFLRPNNKGLEIYLQMARHNESTLLATGHVEAKLFLWRQSKELSCKACHVSYEIGIDPMIDNLKNTPVLTSLNDFLANLSSPAINFIDTSKRDDWNFTAELIVSNFGTLIFVPNKARLQGLLPRKSRES